MMRSKLKFKMRYERMSMKKILSQRKRSRDIKCFKCLGHGHIDANEEQRENIFHTRCQIWDKVCGMII